MQSYGVSDESYCSPWDLKTQEEKFKLLNKQCQTSSLTDTLPHPSTTNNSSKSLLLHQTNINKIFHRTGSVRTSSSSPRKFIKPPILPPLPPGGLIPPCQCNINNTSRTQNLTIENLDTSYKSTQSIPFEKTLVKFKRISSSIENNSLIKTQTDYEQPWDTSKTSFTGSLQKLSQTEKSKSSMIYPYIDSDDRTIIPIERYLWYHFTISRRQAEDILQFRPSGSFLVRQSESGNHNNDYSLSIKTPTNYVHMRICYSNGYYILGECSRPFFSVSSMIKYFSQTFVPIRGAAHIKLGTPVLRWEILSSSLSHEEIV